MRVGLVRLVALLAECEVVAASTVKVELKFRDGLHASVTAVPEIVAIIEQLLLRRILGLFGHRFSHLVLEVFLQLLGWLEVVMHLSLNMDRFLLVLLQKLQVDGFVGLDVELFVFLIHHLVLVVLLAKHLGHRLVVDVGDKICLEFLLHTL